MSHVVRWYHTLALPISQTVLYICIMVMVNKTGSLVIAAVHQAVHCVVGGGLATLSKYMASVNIWKLKVLSKWKEHKENWRNSRESTMLCVSVWTVDRPGWKLNSKYLTRSHLESEFVMITWQNTNNISSPYLIYCTSKSNIDSLMTHPLTFTKQSYYMWNSVQGG